MASLTNSFQFVDRSYANPTGWAWDFGDGVGTSTAQNPAYTYPAVAAVYLPRLASTALSACGSAPVTDRKWHTAVVRWYIPNINGQWLPSTAIMNYQTIGGTATIVTTEADAIATLLAGSSWSGWATKSGKASTLSSYQIPVGSTFAYQQAQWEVTLSGLAPSTAYFFYAQMWQGLYGQGVYSLLSTTLYSAATDGSGNFTCSGSVPVSRGFDTFAYLINTP